MIKKAAIAAFFLLYWRSLTFKMGCEMTASYQLECHSQVLFVRAFGITTMRDVTDYVNDFRRLVRPIFNRPWACVLDMRCWQPSPAEQFSVLRDNTTWCMHHNLALSVILLPSDPLLAWQFIQTTNVAKPDSFRSYKAVDDEDVLEILQREGFSLRHENQLSREAG